MPGPPGFTSSEPTCLALVGGRPALEGELDRALGRIGVVERDRQVGALQGAVALAAVAATPASWPARWTTCCRAARSWSSVVPFDPLVLVLELVLPVPVVAGDVPATSTVPLDAGARRDHERDDDHGRPTGGTHDCRCYGRPATSHGGRS